MGSEVGVGQDSGKGEAQLPRLTILFGSETGNAQDVAERIEREAARRHFDARVCPADAFPMPESLSEERLLVFVVATTGQGEMPGNMQKAWRFLLRKKLPRSFLGHSQYAVFGLGDSSYQQYNVAAKKLDRRLLDLGATPLVPRGLGDDQHPSGYEAALDPWLLSLWAALRQAWPLPPGLLDPPPSEPAPPLSYPKLRVTVRPPALHAARPRPQGDGEGLDSVRWTRDMGRAVAMLDAAQLGAAASGEELQAARSGGPPQEAEPVGQNGSSPAPGAHIGGPEWCRTNPFLAQLVANRRLTAQDHSQDVRHIELDISKSGIAYSPGDVLHVWPCQPESAVLAFLELCHVDPAATTRVESALGQPVLAGQAVRSAGLEGGNGESGPGAGGAEAEIKAFDLVAATLDVAAAPPRRFFFEVLAQFARDEREKEKLLFFASAEGRDELYEYNQRERRSVLEVLEEFPSASPVPLSWLLQACPRLRPRAFSISSSPRRHPGQCHISMAVVQVQTPLKRTRWGLCSRWLSLLHPNSADPPLVPVWVAQGTLPLPPPQVPAILVGPGTGCAPFRGFLHDRFASTAAADALQATAPDGPEGYDSALGVNGHSKMGTAMGSGPPALGQSAGGPIAPCLFFFGCRYQHKDFLYKSEWEELSKAGPLSPAVDGAFFAAFSRDQPRKVYVQHKIREHGRQVWDMLRKGACVYIAGSANKMPNDVIAALVDVVGEEGLLDKAAAEQWVKSLQRVGRLFVECWS